MNIVKTIPAKLSKKELYQLTMSPKAQKVSDAEGSVLEIKASCLYEDTDETTGEVRTILSFLTEDVEIFGTNSATFQKDYSAMCELFGDEPFPIEVISGTSKAGRKFYTCAYAGD